MATQMTRVLDLIARFNARHIDGVMTFITEQPVYHNMPMKSVSGLSQIRKTIEFFIGPADNVEWEVRNIAETGSLVFTEWIDHFLIGGKHVELPVAGIFETREDNVLVWSDYFELATWNGQTTK